jgi:quercetin dioxygenase-like cupin family protein
MSKVRIHEAKDIAWTKVRDAFPAEMLSQVDEPVLESRVSVHEPGGDHGPHLTEADYRPGAKISLHTHSADEIMYVVSGSLVVGNRELKPGSSMFIAAETLYGFAAGQHGVRIAIFRPTGKDVSLSKAEYMARRAQHCPMP